MSKGDCLIKGGLLASSKGIQQLDIRIANGVFTEIGEQLVANASEQVIDATGKYVFPGLIDTHVHFREPGLTHKATWLTESAAALAGGVTTVFDMPNTEPPTLSPELVQEKLAIAKANSYCNYGVFLGVSARNLDCLLYTSDAADEC
jgi:dihydroorotase